MRSDADRARLLDMSQRVRGVRGKGVALFLVAALAQRLVLLPGVDGWGAFEVAKRLCESVRSEPVEGPPVTMSLGVAVIAEGETWSFDRLFDDADRALYEAKRGGRDRVAQQRDLVLLAS